MKRLISDFPSFTIVQWITSINLIYYYLVLLLFLAGAIDLIKQKDWQKLSIPFLSVIIGTAVLLFFGHGETPLSYSIHAFHSFICRLFYRKDS
jgi:uncharacterized protein with PQ loop repeat